MAHERITRATTPARRASVLDAALACFSERGLEGTTVSDIQSAAGCSVGSIYHHFGSKEGIAEELFILGVQRLNQRMLKRLRRCKTGEESVRAVVGEYVRWATRESAMACYLHSRDVSFSADARERLRDIHREYVEALFAWFAPFVETGEMRRLPVQVYIPLISGPIQEYVRRWLSGQHTRSPQQVEALFADAAWNAVKAR